MYYGRRMGDAMDTAKRAPSTLSGLLRTYQEARTNGEDITLILETKNGRETFSFTRRGSPAAPRRGPRPDMRGERGAGPWRHQGPPPLAFAQQ